MEADWSVEIGPSLPEINAGWDGFVDLRSSQEKLKSIEEARSQPALREALLKLNTSESVFTTKCDCWKLDEADIDADEFAASRDAAHAGFASYIDVVDRDAARFASFELHEQRVRAITSALLKLDVRQGRVDLVVRAAVYAGQSGFAVTLYAAGCGADSGRAQAAWRAVLGAAVAATIAGAAHPPYTGE
jgi:hypothetical protein